MQFDTIKVGMRCLKENSCNAIENDSERERERLKLDGKACIKTTLPQYLIF